jgi:hypothetical protein
LKNKVDITSFNEAVMTAACEAIPRRKRKRLDWFSRSREKLLEAFIDNRGRAYNEFSKNPECARAKEKLRIARNKLRTTVKLAKNSWTEEVAEKTTASGFLEAPKDAWKAIRTIQESFTGHHAPSASMKMRLPSGKLAENDRENMEAFAPHFENIYGQSPDVDIQGILDEIPQRPVFNELGHPPTLEEIETSIQDMENDKASGASGVNANALKNLSNNAVKALHQILVKSYNGTVDPAEWHIATLKCLFKKGDSSNPSSWRGICLKDITARITSSILNKRLLKFFTTHGVETQYGTKGCQHGLFVLRSALETRRQHDLPTWALFVDLVKAFDTVNHDLLFALLETARRCGEAHVHRHVRQAQDRRIRA